MIPKLRKDILFPELSYQIVGCAYKVWRELGYGHLEKVYQKGMAEALRSSKISFVEQFSMPVFFGNRIIGRGYADFLVEEKVIIEIKKGAQFSLANIQQVSKYLASAHFQLAILMNFTSQGVMTRRIVNIQGWPAPPK